MFPKTPKTLLTTHQASDIMDEKTIKEESFLLSNNYDIGIVIFSCRTNLVCLAKCKIILVNGTFYSAPKFFLQMFTVDGLLNEEYIPLVFCLLKNKKKKKRRELLGSFKIIKDECSKKGLIPTDINNSHSYDKVKW